MVKLLPLEVGPLNPDGTELVVGAILFALVYALMLVPLKRIRQVMVTRQDLIEVAVCCALDRREEARAVREMCERVIAEGRREAALVRRSLAEEGARLMEEARVEGLRERAGIVAAGQQRISAERAAAEAALRSDAEALAVELAGRILGEPVTAVAPR
ncbi:hypothetical protein [Streptomyces sp. NPDC048603]|uniref:F0F1 ATP synthase subunit B family protein n=1 Tax=Streptomyces sp. NPDC048603 TaxID=3365577 RepID=UPI003714A7EB